MERRGEEERSVGRKEEDNEEERWSGRRVVSGGRLKVDLQPAVREEGIQTSSISAGDGDEGQVHGPRAPKTSLSLN
jgi:hypothetical protein